MKKLIYLFLMLGIFVTYSCGGSGSDKVKEEATEENTKQSGEIKDCDDFLAHYEEWVDEYLEVIEAYLKNPADASTATRYMELMQETMGWSTKWVAMADCADDEEYEQKFEEISKKVEEKMKEFGIE